MGTQYSYQLDIVNKSMDKNQREIKCSSHSNEAIIEFRIIEKEGVCCLLFTKKGTLLSTVTKHYYDRYRPSVSTDVNTVW